MGRKITRSELLRVIDLCLTIEKRGINPFEINIRKTLEKLRSYLPRWKLLEELLLDAEALRRISRIIKLQEHWVLQRSSSLYIDPMTVELKIKMLEPERLAEVFLLARHPIVSLEQISTQRLKEAVEYWNQLPPLGERFREEAVKARETGFIDRGDLRELGILSSEEFQQKISSLWKELKSKGPTQYQDFVYADSFEETVVRAYVTSFMVTEGLAHLKVKPLEGETILIPRDKPLPVNKLSKPKSVAVAVTYGDWARRKKSGRAS